MHRLIVAPRREEAQPDQPDSGSSQTWRDRDGVPRASGWQRGDFFWIDIHGIATYRFGRQSTDVVAFPTTDADEELVSDAFFRFVLPMAFHVGGKEVLHASAVRSSSGIVCFCGLAMAGKSTIAAGLSRRGLELWADDAVVLEFDGRRSSVIAIPFRLNLRPDSAAFFDRDRTAPLAREGVQSGKTAPLAAIVVLEQLRSFTNGSRVQIEPLPAAVAFDAVVQHAYRFDLSDPRRKQRLVQNFLDVVAGVPVFRARYPRDMVRLPEVLDELGEIGRSLQSAVA